MVRLLDGSRTQVGDNVLLQLPAEHGHVFDATGMALPRCDREA